MSLGHLKKIWGKVLRTSETPREHTQHMLNAFTILFCCNNYIVILLSTKNQPDSDMRYCNLLSSLDLYIPGEL